MKRIFDEFSAFLVTQKRVASHTFHAYSHDIQQFLLFRSRHENVEPRELMLLYREWLIDRGLSPRTMARKLSALRTFFTFVADRYPRYAHLQELLQSTGQLPRRLQQLPRSCTAEEMQRMLSYKPTSIKRRYDRLICLILYATGMRVSEFVCLTPAHIQLREGRIIVRGKGGRERVIPIPDTVVQEIQQYMNTQSISPVSVSPLFSLSRQQVWRIIRRIACRAGIVRRVSPHTMRHTLATLCLENNWDLRALQMLLGHERITTTEHYIHVTTRFMQAEYRKRHPRK